MAVCKIVVVFNEFVVVYEKKGVCEIVVGFREFVVADDMKMTVCEILVV